MKNNNNSSEALFCSGNDQWSLLWRRHKKCNAPLRGPPFTGSGPVTMHLQCRALQHLAAITHCHHEPNCKLAVISPRYTKQHNTHFKEHDATLTEQPLLRYIRLYSANGSSTHLVIPPPNLSPYNIIITLSINHLYLLRAISRTENVRYRSVTSPRVPLAQRSNEQWRCFRHVSNWQIHKTRSGSVTEEDSRVAVYAEALGHVKC